MPISQISMRAGKSAAYREAVLDSLYWALRSSLNVPDGDQFMEIIEYDASNFRYGDAFGIKRSDDLIYIRISIFSSRSEEDKARLFRAISNALAENPGVRPEDVFIVITDAPKENWSVGCGEAQFGAGRPSHA